MTSRVKAAPKADRDGAGRFLEGNPGGQKGIVGRRPVAIALRCESLVITQIIPIIERYLVKQADNEKACKDRGFQWCAQYLANLLPKEIQHSGEVDLNVQDARRTFQGRMARLAERLGSAAMPEGLE